MMEIFDKLGLKIGTPKGDELPALCPFHKDKHMGNFSINLKSGLFHCFSCNARGIIYDLPLKDVGIEEFRNAWNAIKKADELVDYRLNYDLVKYYIRQGYSKYALSRINHFVLNKYDVYQDCCDNPVFLVRDWNGEYQSAWVRLNETGKYYLLEPLDSKVKGHLFGLHLPPTEKYVLNEGFFDAMSVYQDTGYKAVCGNGVFLTEKQIENIRKLQPLYVMFDGDNAGRRGRNRLFEQLEDVDVYFCGGYNCDPDELTKKRKIEVLNNAKSRMEYLEIYETRNN